MKQLLLIRHAKSSWDMPLDDKSRPLINRGIKDSQAVFQECMSFLPKKFTIWSSDSVRATQTATIFADIIGVSVSDIHFKKELYTFEMKKLEQIIKGCKDEIINLIIFGHNDAITDFVNKFGDVNVENVPTSGFVCLEFEGNEWATISKGKLKKILFPKDLK